MCIFHKWKIIKVEKYNDAEYKIPGTLVYKQCSKCGKIKEESIDGHWDFTELTGLLQKNLGGDIYVEDKKPKDELKKSKNKIESKAETI